MRRNGYIRERSKGVFEIRYTVGVDSASGKRIRTSKTFHGSQKDAIRELRRLLISVDTDQHIEPSRMLIKAFLEGWLITVKSHVSPKTHERYSELVTNYLIPAFGQILLTRLSPTFIQDVYNRWEHTGRRDGKIGGLSARTRLHMHRVFRSALKHAVRLRLIANNPADAVLTPRPRKATIKTLTVEQSATLLESLKASNSRVYWPVLLALATGMRRGEIAALRWKNLDFDKKTIRVIESIEQVQTMIRFKAPKTDRTRAVMLPDYALEELKTWKKTQLQNLEKLGVTASEDTFICGRSWDGGVVKPDSISAEFRVAIRALPGFPHVRFHDLRHSHATQLMEQGIHPKIAQERLGHSTITTTLDLYSHAVDTMQNEAVSKLDTVFRSAIRTKNSGPKLG